MSPSNLESWLFNSTALRERTFAISSRSLKSASTDIEARFVLAIGTSERIQYNDISAAPKTDCCQEQDKNENGGCCKFVTRFSADSIGPILLCEPVFGPE